jgi:hypothetical protein
MSIAPLQVIFDWCNTFSIRHFSIISLIAARSVTNMRPIGANHMKSQHTASDFQQVFFLEMKFGCVFVLGFRLGC